MTSDASVIPAARSRKSTEFFILLFLLVAAVALRVPYLNSPGYVLDELWTAEIAAARGSVHVHFPVNQIMRAPDIFHLAHAPPWWKIWTHMEVTHPPLYYILLRLWMEVWGEGDSVGRSLSVISSLAAIAILFDVVRLTSGRRVAFWACLLMVVAPLQIEYARLNRNYEIAVAMTLAAADFVVRIEKWGLNRRRILGLLFTALCSPLSHYFTIGPIAALVVYALIALKGNVRKKTLVTFVIAGVLFLLIWGPYFYQQKALFSLEDPGVSFAKDDRPGHVLRVLNLALLVPAKMLVSRLNLHVTAYALALLYVLPLLMFRRRPDLLLWGLWLLGTVTSLGILDLCRDSAHLGFVRYILFAGPAVFVLIPAISFTFIKPAWLVHILPGAAVVLCLCFIRDAYTIPAADSGNIADTLAANVTSSDLIAFASRGALSWTRGPQAMMLIRYLHPIPCPLVFLDAPPTGDTKVKMLAARSIIIFTSSDHPTAFLPGYTVQFSIPFSYAGNASVLTPPGRAR